MSVPDYLRHRPLHWGQLPKNYAVYSFVCPECGDEMTPLRLGVFECSRCWLECEDGTWTLRETLIPMSDPAVNLR